MKVSNALKQENIIHFSSVNSKEELLNQLIAKLIDSQQDGELSETLKLEISKTVFERESKSSTGIGMGIAFPHGRVSGLNKPMIALGVIKDGVEYDAIDKQPVKIVFLFLFPGNRQEMGVKMQAVFSRFLSNSENLNMILETERTDLILQNIEDAGLEIDTPITAQDLMFSPKVTLSKELPLSEVTQLMDKYNTEVAPVLDENNNLLGEIDCIHLFQLELPDYIKELHSVPPIHDFNPFAKYFSEDAEVTVEHVYNKNIAVVDLKASMLEIVFLLAVKKHSIVHVCENNKLIGEIDRITVINKVFNF